jgi:hypothetical protein
MFLNFRKERAMLTKFRNGMHGFIGALALLVSLCVLHPMAAPVMAQSPIYGQLDFQGASKVEKTSGVWIDGQYVGYLGELKGSKKIMLLPGDHELAIRQAGYMDFTEKVTVEPKQVLLVPVRMTKAANVIWPKVTAQLKVDIQPDRAAVFVDDKFLGHAAEFGGSFHSMLLSPGTHRIKVELPGYQTFESDVTLVAGQKSEVKTTLAKGSIHQADSLIDQANNSANHDK